MGIDLLGLGCEDGWVMFGHSVRPVHGSAWDVLLVFMVEFDFLSVFDIVLCLFLFMLISELPSIQLF